MQRSAALINNPPSVDAGLLDEAPWDARVERLQPVMDAYFERTRILTGGNELNYDGVPSFGLTNETFYHDVLRAIEGIGGAYIGVGAVQNFIFPVIAGARHAFAVDYNAFIPFGFVPVWGALLALSPTRAHFAANIFSRVMDNATAEDLKGASGSHVIDEVSDLDHSTQLFERVRNAIATLISRSAGDEQMVSAAMRWMERLRKDMFELLKLYRSDPVEIFTSEDAYQRQRSLFLQGRISGMAADWAKTDMQPLFGAIAAAGMTAGLVYVSNIESWFPKYHFEANDVERVNTLYRNLSEIAGKGSPRLISSLNIAHPVLLDMQGYLRRAFPFTVPPEEAARYQAEFVNLRYHVIWSVLGNFAPDDMVWRRLWQAYNSTAGSLMKSLLDEVGDLFRINGDRPFGWNEFDLKMTQRCDAYRDLPYEVREMLMLNLMDLGVVKPPDLIPYQRNELAVRRGSGNGGQGGTIITGMTPSGETHSSSPAMQQGMSPAQNVQMIMMAGQVAATPLTGGLGMTQAMPLIVPLPPGIIK